MTNVKSISLSEFDGRMHLIRDNPSLVRVLDLHLLGGGHVKKDVPSSVVSNIYPNIELNSACYFDNDNKVRCYTNREKNQLLGNGDSVTFENGYFIGTVKETDGSELMNVQDLSMNRNSVCAILLQPDQSYGQTSVYCWGSAFFGQMGYMSDIIDTDRAVSYDDVLSANSFFQNRTKYYATPVNLWGN